MIVLVSYFMLVFRHTPFVLLQVRNLVDVALDNVVQLSVRVFMLEIKHTTLHETVLVVAGMIRIGYKAK